MANSAASAAISALLKRAGAMSRRVPIVRGLRQHLSTPSRIRRLRRTALLYARPFLGRNLPALATIANTDKWNEHWYAQHYQTHLARFRRKRLNLLEIGIGGYDDPDRGGESLLVWKHYFPKAHVFGLDIHPKHGLDERRITTIHGSQVNAALLRRLSDEVGGFDLIIDDGSHRNEHVIETFTILFPLLKEGGYYVVEDTQTSYWPDFGGVSVDDVAAPTTMNFFRRLIDSMNHPEFLTPDYQPTYFDQHIFAMHFYHNLVFVHKHVSAEGSNAVR